MSSGNPAFNLPGKYYNYHQYKTKTHSFYYSIIFKIDIHWWNTRRIRFDSRSNQCLSFIGYRSNWCIKAWYIRIRTGGFFSITHPVKVRLLRRKKAAEIESNRKCSCQVPTRQEWLHDRRVTTSHRFARRCDRWSTFSVEGQRLDASTWFKQKITKCGWPVEIWNTRVRITYWEETIHKQWCSEKWIHFHFKNHGAKNITQWA